MATPCGDRPTSALALKRTFIRFWQGLAWPDRFQIRATQIRVRPCQDGCIKKPQRGAGASVSIEYVDQSQPMASMMAAESDLNPIAWASVSFLPACASDSVMKALNTAQVAGKSDCA